MIVIDASNLIVGRMGTIVAKKALLGNEVAVVNVEKAVVTGKPEVVVQRYFTKKNKGVRKKGTVLKRNPEMLVKRIVRGMLPYKQERGKVALERIKFYLGVPEEFKDKKAETVENANISKVMNTKHITILELSRALGAKV